MSRLIRDPLAIVGCALIACSASARESVATTDPLFTEFQKVFAPAELPATLRDAASGPAKCATLLIREFAAERDQLSPEEAGRIDEYLGLARGAASLQYMTEHFLIWYELSGVNAVSATDVAPANGIPDYVENIGAWAEMSWDHHVDALGLAQPVPMGSKLEIAFREMNAYGYTDPLQGVARIVLHRSFEGFPANHDPEGSARGAAKVTVAHELEHACQLAMSGWTEGSWLEADAVWAEDRVFDVVDDYLNYLGSGSPVSNPDSWAWQGAGYEDCLWERSLSEAHGDGLIAEFFHRRAAHRGESVAQSYDAVLRAHDSSLAAALGRLSLWSYFCGANALARPEGFQEAASYPTPPIHANLSGVPANATGTMAGMGSRYFLASAATMEGRPQLYVTGDAGREYALHAIVLDRSGVRRVFSIPVAAGHSDITEIPLEWSDIAFLTIAVAAVDAIEAPAFSSVNLDTPVAVGVLPPSGKTQIELAQNYPNPFQSGTTIAFSLSLPSSARLEVFDATGRLVRTLLNDPSLSAGQHHAFWDGSDDRGMRCAPGVYALRLQSPGESASRKIHLLR
jgi:hypothetical protein